MDIAAKAQALDPEEMDAWYSGKTYRLMRIIPFGGPIPSADGKGRDLDNEYFDHRTDIKPHLFPERPVMFHHGADPTGLMGDTVFGKATDLHQEEDGWWERIWLTLADARMAKIKSLEAKGRALFGSSTPLELPGVRVKRGKDGHIEQWPHAESTLSFSPQNTWAILRPAKAVLDAVEEAQIDALPYAKALLHSIDNLGADLSLTSDPGPGEVTAKAGRVLSATNERTIREAQELLDRVLRLLNPTPPAEGDASPEITS
jgi:hypothetical protein